ncbi:MAG: LysR family transcriptional regulator [Ramlibacter sp.]|nr:LysR family transcriptional regulator [Ramlibacter sp.]
MSRIGDRGEMEAFVRAVELGGFSAAARDLDLSPSALSKLVDRLERSLQVRLLRRTTRKLATTPEGDLFLARCRRILAEIEDAENEVGRSRDRPRGRLNMHVGVGFAIHQVVEVLPVFLRRHPEVQVDLRIEDARLDLVKEGLDLSVRPGPPDETLVARSLFDFDRIVCAAPAYIARHGAPRKPEELAQHRCLCISGTFSSERWSFDGPRGRVAVKVEPAARVNNADAIYRLALDGMGIVRVNEFICAPSLRDGRLVPVMPEYPCADGSQMLALYPHERNRLPRVAAMLDFLVESFAARPWRTAPTDPTPLPPPAP